MNKILFALFVLFYLGHPSFVQSQEVRFTHLSVDRGLSQNSVHSIIQDQNGFMWFATSDGLNRYDGYSFRIFKNEPTDSNSIYSNNIHCLYIDDSTLWIGFGNGTIDCFNAKKNFFTHIHLPPPEGKTENISNVNGITENKSGQLFIATDGDGIFIFTKQTGKWQNFRNEKFNQLSIPSNNIATLTFDKNGVLWCATADAGVFSWDPGSFKVSQYRNLNALGIAALYPDRSGKIWVSAWSAGINVIDPATGKIVSNRDTSCYLNKQLPYGLVSNFMEDRNGLLWLSTAEDGVISYNKENGKSTVYKKKPDDENSLSDNLVLSLFEDKSGLLWFGTWQGGINIFDPKKQLMEHYYHNSNVQESLINNVVWCINKGKNDKPWIATSDGVYSFDPQTHQFKRLEFDKFSPEAPAPNTIIHAVLEDRDGNVWMGSNGNGLFHYNPSTKKCVHYLYDRDGSSSTITALMLDSRGDLWIGSKDGLYLYQRDKDKFTRYLNANDDAESISSNSVSSFAESKDGKIWVATPNAGLNLLNLVNEKIRRFQHDPKNPNSLPDNKIFSLHIDKNDILWIGTKSGLCFYIEEKEKFVSFTEKDGLPDNNIKSIENDDDGTLWLSTNKGLCSFNPVTKKIKSYDVNDGVQSNEFKANSSYTSTNGYMYFGGVKGLNRFNPLLMVDNPNVPNPVIVGFTVLNKPYPLKEDIVFIKEIKLGYKDYFFSFELAGLEYTNSVKNKYQYMLEGFNEEWINTGTARTVTFTNLDPGDYTLHVKACNNDGIWSGDKTIHIIITPPFWKTKWFYTACILIVIVCTYSYIKYREKTLIREKLVLENKVEIRTKELKVEKLRVEEAHKEITDSIHYAKRIQRALLASDNILKKNLPEYFVLYKPKDIVSGDFYWCTPVPTSSEKEGIKTIIATCDCTGHGVPGAFMSLLNISKLGETINEKKIILPHLILNQVRDEIIKVLNPVGAEIESKDGMDCVLCLFDFHKMELQFAAANNTLWLLRNNEIIEYGADKMPVGIYHGVTKSFTLQTIQLLKNDVIYTFSDGYADQFGGNKGKKFMYKQLKELLLVNSHLSMADQKKVLKDTIENWRGALEQVDDILVIGIRV